MRTASRGFVISLALLFSSASAPVTVAQKPRARPAAPRTVRDYFLLVPESYVGYPLEFRKYLLKGGLGVVVDVKNGYISYDASDNPEEFEFAIFRRGDGGHVVAYSIPYDPDFLESTPKFMLLTYRDGRWSEVTNELLPEPFDRGKRLSYKLPRRGREVVVTDEGGRRQYTLAWKGDRFVLDRTGM